MKTGQISRIRKKNKPTKHKIKPPFISTFHLLLEASDLMLSSYAEQRCNSTMVLVQSIFSESGLTRKPLVLGATVQRV